MPDEEASTSGAMEESGIIEPLPDDAPELMDEGTSDYDPSLAETQFGSLTSSVTSHIWEYGRCVSHNPDLHQTAH